MAQPLEKMRTVDVFYGEIQYSVCVDVIVE